MARIFITGVSGYIGGEVLYRLKESALTSASIACLNRIPEKAEQIRKIYPDVEIIQGDLDDHKIIQKEAERADVVLHLASTKHLPSTKAIVAGLTSSSRQASTPGCWIQISGASLYAGQEIAEGKLGEASEKVHSDTSDIESILSTIRASASRAVEQIAISQDASVLRTALIIGALIYGVGQGPCNTRSIQAPEIARSILKLGHGFRLLKGKNAWSNVHIGDIGTLICLLTEAALTGKNVGWNESGIYHPEHGRLTFGELNALIAQEATKQKLIENDELKEIDAKAADELGSHMSILWGTNAVIKGERAQRDLGWTPKERSLIDDIPDLVRREAEAFKLH